MVGKYGGGLAEWCAIMEQEKGHRRERVRKRRFARSGGTEGEIPSAECNEYRALPAQALQRRSGRSLHTGAGFYMPFY